MGLLLPCKGFCVYKQNYCAREASAHSVNGVLWVTTDAEQLDASSFM